MSSILIRELFPSIWKIMEPSLNSAVFALRSICISELCFSGENVQDNRNGGSSRNTHRRRRDGV
jgi:hypothetical protein